MANATQYQYPLVEVAKHLLKRDGVRDGLWMVGVNFAITSTVAGPDQQSISPAMVVGVEKLQLTRTEAMLPGMEALTIDASKLD